MQVCLLLQLMHLSQLRQYLADELVDPVFIDGCDCCLLGHGCRPLQLPAAVYDRERLLGRLAWNYQARNELFPAARAEERLDAMEAMEIEGNPIFLRRPFSVYHTLLPDGAVELDGSECACLGVARFCGGPYLPAYDYHQLVSITSGNFLEMEPRTARKAAREWIHEHLLTVPGGPIFIWMTPHETVQPLRGPQGQAACECSPRL